MDRDEVSRREFLRRSTEAGLALASAYFMASGWASAKPVPANDRVRFGMIGVGMRGADVLDATVRLAGTECVQACDVFDDRHLLANEIISKATGKTVPTTRHYHDLLDNKDIDCVVVSVPDHLHKQIIVDACAAGKDVYCEKPMTHELDEGFAIIEAANKGKRIVEIGSQRRSSATFAKAKELMEQKVIGEVNLVEAVLGRNSPCGSWVYDPPSNLSPANVDWKAWLGPAPERPLDPLRFARWRAFKEYGEGLSGDLFVHALTGIHYVMGLNEPPKRAQSTGGLFYWKDGRDFPDMMSTLYDYPTLRVAVLMTQTTHAKGITRFFGTRGTMEIVEDGEQLTVTRQSGEDESPCYYDSSYPGKVREAYEKAWHAKNDPKPGATRAIDGSDSYIVPPDYHDLNDHLWRFFQSVKTRQPSVEDAVFGNNTSIACHMANHSYFHESAARWDASARRITV